MLARLSDFNEEKVRVMGRTARGVRGIRLGETDKVKSLITVTSESGFILTVTENGYGKRTPIKEYPLRGRGGSGVFSIKTSERNGVVVGAKIVDEDDEVMLISDKGMLIRIPVNQVSVISRNTQGVRLVTLKTEENLVNLEKIVEYKNNGTTIAETENIE